MAIQTHNKSAHSFSDESSTSSLSNYQDEVIWIDAPRNSLVSNTSPSRAPTSEFWLCIFRSRRGTRTHVRCLIVYFLSQPLHCPNLNRANLLYILCHRPRAVPNGIFILSGITLSPGARTCIAYVVAALPRRHQSRPHCGHRHERHAVSTPMRHRRLAVQIESSTPPGSKTSSTKLPTSGHVAAKSADSPSQPCRRELRFTAQPCLVAQNSLHPTQDGPETMLFVTVHACLPSFASPARTSAMSLSKRPLVTSQSVRPPSPAEQVSRKGLDPKCSWKMSARITHDHSTTQRRCAGI